MPSVPQTTRLHKGQAVAFSRILQSHLPDLRERYGVPSLHLFGSYVRNQATPKSDLDVLVEFEPGRTPGLLAFINLQNHLSDLLEIDVDLVMGRALNPQIGQRIRDEAVEIT